MGVILTTYIRPGMILQVTTPHKRIDEQQWTTLRREKGRSRMTPLVVVAMARTATSLLNTNLSTKGPEQIKEFIVLKVPSIFWDLAWVVPIPSNFCSIKVYVGIPKPKKMLFHVSSWWSRVNSHPGKGNHTRFRPPKTNMTMKHPPLEDVSLNKRMMISRCHDKWC